MVIDGSGKTFPWQKPVQIPPTSGIKRSCLGSPALSQLAFPGENLHFFMGKKIPKRGKKGYIPDLVHVK